MIKLNNIYLKRNNKVVLEDVNLNIESEQQWVIIGKNGSGKTSLLEMVTGYLFPSSGSVEVLGNQYGSCNIPEVRKKIGYITPNLFEKLSLSDSVLEVVATGNFGYLRFYQQIPQEALEKASDIMDRIQISHMKDRPLGLLSQGERKKVLLARALINDPSVLIMDEPCAGLDLEERERFLESVQKLAEQNVRMIYVTHHLEEIIPCFTHAAILKEGRIIASGEKSQVLTDEALSEAFHLPLSIQWHKERPWVIV
ncbi:ABC transporter ATP-binding protein [Ammoniphilus sp. 3BR4]|uniref:ABC transporter ATP-binding protein n=1 Tax=Ammoniphilus sp. 3BR4 TaxID=3158265 RepID=UPI0034658822